MATYCDYVLQMKTHTLYLPCHLHARQPLNSHCPRETPLNEGPMVQTHASDVSQTDVQLSKLIARLEAGRYELWSQLRLDIQCCFEIVIGARIHLER